MREIRLISTKITSTKKSTKQKKLIQKEINELSLIECIEQILVLSENSQLSPSFFKKSLPYTQKAAKTLGITNNQAILFSLFMNKFEYRSIDFSDISNFINTTPFFLIKYSQDIQVLVDLNFVRVLNSSSSYNQYFVPKPTIEAIKNNQPPKPKSYKTKTAKELMDILNDIFDGMYNENLGEFSQNNIEEILYILSKNPNLPFIKQLKTYKMKKYHIVIFLFFCHCCINKGDEKIEIRDLIQYFRKEKLFNIRNQFQTQSDVLFEKNLIQNTMSNGFSETDCFCLTNKAKKEFLGMFKINTTEEKRKEVISHDAIVQKSLFYNSKEKEQIKTLSNLLQQKKFKEITETLANKGMRKGFAILFYGYPGTGKTETVMQIARQTQRDVFLVDISETKSKWFGESEKEIKAIFDNYKKMVQKTEKAPILLFNEADAVINTRQSLNNAGSVDKTENAMQNIILQEMENLEGIMIATTNLTENLDKAFERRFLYKINFQKPTFESKQKIWKSMIDDLQEKELVDLAKEHDFSGGQIENIARKKTIQEIIEGKKIDFEKLQTFCNEEILETKNNRKTIGFNR